MLTLAGRRDRELQSFDGLTADLREECIQLEVCRLSGKHHSTTPSLRAIIRSSGRFGIVAHRIHVSMWALAGVFFHFSAYQAADLPFWRIAPAWIRHR